MDTKQWKNINGIQIRNAAPRSAEVLIYEQVGSDIWAEGVTAKGFAQELKALGDVDTIDVRINSSGGSLFEGLGIYNTLRAHGARIQVSIDGAALSIASAIACAGDTVRMADNALMMIHDPMTIVAGGTSDMRAAIEMMERAKENLVTVYRTRTRRSRQEIAEAMTAETWYTAQEAKAFGLVDEIVVSKVRIAAHVGSYQDRIPDRLRPVINSGLSAAESEPTMNEVKKATIEELEGIPGSTAEQQINWLKRGVTLAQANGEDEAVKAALKAQSRKVGLMTRGDGTNLTGGTTNGDPLAMWEEAVQAEMKRCRGNRVEAVILANRKNPGLREAFNACRLELATANGYRPGRR